MEDIYFQTTIVECSPYKDVAILQNNVGHTWLVR